jgi:putative transposase
MILLMQTREQAGSEASPTAGVVDSQGVKTTESGRLRGCDVPVCRSEAPKIRHDGPYLRRVAAAGGDAGKKINGRKRHLVTDTIGLPLNLAVDAANIEDRNWLSLACRWIKRQFPWLLCLFADVMQSMLPIAALV